jgi:hypothetical protein
MNEVRSLSREESDTRFSFLGHCEKAIFSMFTIWRDICDFLRLATIIYLSSAKLPIWCRADMINALR